MSISTENISILSHVFDLVQIKAGNVLSKKDRFMIASYLNSKNGNKDTKYDILIRSACRLHYCRKEFIVKRLFSYVRKYEQVGPNSLNNILKEVNDLFGTGK